MANWQLDGNAASAGDFLGTTNAQPLSVQTNGTERVRVLGDGKVGVGLADPRTPLHVLGRISTGLDHTSGGAITFFPPDGFAWFHIDNGPARRSIGRLRISHGTSPGSNELMTLQQDGNVGIGLPNPAVKLHAVGNRIRLEQRGKKLDLRADGGSVDVQSDTHDLYLHSVGPSGRNRVIINPFGGEGNVGVGTTNPTDKLHVAGNVRANDFIVTSDVRLKTDIRPIEGALKKVTDLRGVEFAWKDAEPGPGGSAPQRTAGVVAQEVAAVAPELVENAGGPEAFRGVNLSGVVGTLIEAVKELAAENSALRRRLDALEGAGGQSSSAAAAG
jgi:hypothetical protein